jgi:hypothetical protein
MKLIITVLVSVVLLSSASIASAADSLLSVGVGIEFANGKYGTGTSTESLTLPLTIRAYPTDRLDLELIVPYIYQSSGATTAAGMFRFRNGRSSSGTGNGNGKSQGFAGIDSSGSQSGIGDLTLKAGYAMMDEGKYYPRLRPVVSLQFPTGDDDKGLGTGEFAAGGGMEISKWLGDWYLYGEGIYNFQGRSAELALMDYLGYEAGVGCQLTDRLRSTLLVIGATPPSAFSSAIAEVRAKVNYRLTGRAGLEGYVGAGISNASPDFGAGASLFYDF